MIGKLSESVVGYEGFRFEQDLEPALGPAGFLRVQYQFRFGAQSPASVLALFGRFGETDDRIGVVAPQVQHPVAFPAARVATVHARDQAVRIAVGRPVETERFTDDHPDRAVRRVGFLPDLGVAEHVNPLVGGRPHLFVVCDDFRIRPAAVEQVGTAGRAVEKPGRVVVADEFASEIVGRKRFRTVASGGPQADSKQSQQAVTSVFHSDSRFVFRTI